MFISFYDKDFYPHLEVTLSNPTTGYRDLKCPWFSSALLTNMRTS